MLQTNLRQGKLGEWKYLVRAKRKKDKLFLGSTKTCEIQSTLVQEYKKLVKSWLDIYTCQPHDCRGPADFEWHHEKCHDEVGDREMDEQKVDSGLGLAVAVDQDSQDGDVRHGADEEQGAVSHDADHVRRVELHVRGQLCLDPANIARRGGVVQHRGLVGLHLRINLKVAGKWLHSCVLWLRKSLDNIEKIRLSFCRVGITSIT